MFYCVANVNATMALLEKMLSITRVDDILTVDSGNEKPCKQGARLLESTFAERTILKKEGAMQSNFERIRCKDEQRELQIILQKNPDLLPGEQISPEDPCRWLQVGRSSSRAQECCGLFE